MGQKMIIAGGTGLIGSALKAEAERQGWTVLILSRTPGPGQMVWDPAAGTIDLLGSIECDALVNLAGASIAGKRWTAKRKEVILKSRTQSADTLRKYIEAGRIKPKVYVGASAIGIYGDKGRQAVSDTTSLGDEQEWMVDTVKQWEAAHYGIEQLGIRSCVIRTGLVLSMKEGYLKEILQTAPFGFLTTFGWGRQYNAWIHIQDVVSIYMAVIQDPNYRGTYLACAPNPVSNKTFVKTISKTRGGILAILPVPRFVLAIMLGELHNALFESCNGHPDKLRNAGFKFQFPDIGSAITDLLKKKND